MSILPAGAGDESTMSLPRNLGDFVRRTDDAGRPLIIGVGLDGREFVLTRGAFDAMADSFARGLLKAGIARGDRIALLSANRPDYVALMFGAMRAGIVPVPVNFKFPSATIAQVIADCGARLVIFDHERRAAVDPEKFPGVSFVAFDDGLAAWLDPGPFVPVTPRADEPALSLYTSGSTGRPKGVLLSHASHIWVADTRQRDIDLHDERVLIAAPLYHMNALALAVLVCASGATAIMLPQFQAVAYIEAISRYRCTWLTAVPPMIAMMLREKQALARADLSSVRTVRMGSAPVNDTLARQIRALLPNARIINAYGTTEGGPIVFGGHPDGIATPISSVGYPHREVAVRLAGPDAPDSGVLQMKSPAVMLGYHNRPDVRSPITPDGYYDSADVFRRDGQGFYYFVGRADDMFVSGGENIFPGEVESVLETHPDVAQACVVPVDDDIKGTKPVAFVVPRPGAAIDEETLKRFVLANAPAYQHPRRIWFLDQMLLASTNKIDRATLQKIAAEKVRDDAL
jgi:long-chain acyl-CoA synthetase